MSDRSARGEELFASGYNCAQAVVLSFLDKIPLDDKTAAALASPFGGGMGRMHEVCGAFSGALIVLGFLRGDDGSRGRAGRSEIYLLVQDLAERFKAKHGSLICGELLGMREPKDRGPDDPPLRKSPCSHMVATAIEALQEVLGI